MNVKQYIQDLTSKLVTMWCGRCQRETPHHESTVRNTTYYVCAECGEVMP